MVLNLKNLTFIKFKNKLIVIRRIKPFERGFDLNYKIVEIEPGTKEESKLKRSFSLPEVQNYLKGRYVKDVEDCVRFRVFPEKRGSRLIQKFNKKVDAVEDFNNFKWDFSDSTVKIVSE